MFDDKDIHTMSDDLELSIARISQHELSDHQLAIVNNLSPLIFVNEADHLLHGFTYQHKSSSYM